MDRIRTPCLLLPALPPCPSRLVRTLCVHAHALLSLLQPWPLDSVCNCLTSSLHGPWLTLFCRSTRLLSWRSARRSVSSSAGMTSTFWMLQVSNPCTVKQRRSMLGWAVRRCQHAADSGVQPPVQHTSTLNLSHQRARHACPCDCTRARHEDCMIHSMQLPPNQPSRALTCVQLVCAEEHGLDLPATCRGGICGACVARVSSGTFDQSDIVDLEFTLSPVSHSPWGPCKDPAWFYHLAEYVSFAQPGQLMDGDVQCLLGVALSNMACTCLVICRRSRPRAWRCCA